MATPLLQLDPLKLLDAGDEACASVRSEGYVRLAVRLDAVRFDVRAWASRIYDLATTGRGAYTDRGRAESHRRVEEDAVAGAFAAWEAWRRALRRAAAVGGEGSPTAAALRMLLELDALATPDAAAVRAVGSTLFARVADLGSLRDLGLPADHEARARAAVDAVRAGQAAAWVATVDRTVAHARLRGALEGVVHALEVHERYRVFAEALDEEPFPPFIHSALKAAQARGPARTAVGEAPFGAIVVPAGRRLRDLPLPELCRAAERVAEVIRRTPAAGPLLAQVAVDGETGAACLAPLAAEGWTAWEACLGAEARLAVAGGAGADQARAAYEAQTETRRLLRGLGLVADAPVRDAAAHHARLLQQTSVRLEGAVAQARRVVDDLERADQPLRDLPVGATLLAEARERAATLDAALARRDAARRALPPLRRARQTAREALLDALRAIEERWASARTLADGALPELRAPCAEP